MNPERALAYCANLTMSEWSGMDNEKIIELWRVFRAYINNDYQDLCTQIVPAGILEVWNRCKPLIDGEAQK